MAHLRIALAQLNPTVGDISANADLVVEWAVWAHDCGAHLVVFPEMALTGSPIEDLALRPSFVEASRISINRVASRLEGAGAGEIVAVVGYLDRTEEPRNPRGGQPRSAAAVLHRGRVVTTGATGRLPHDHAPGESGDLDPGGDAQLITVRGVDVGIVIGAQLEHEEGPVAAVPATGAGLLAALSAHPYERRADDIRGELVARRAAEAGCALAYVNLVGGQDELVFDGDSMISDADGTIVVRGEQFSGEIVLADLDLSSGAAVMPETDIETGRDPIRVQRHRLTTAGQPPEELITPTVSARLPAPHQMWSALVLGLRDYCGKNGIEKVVVGLTGGIGSSVVATLACDAIGAGRVHGIHSPGSDAAEQALTVATDLAARTGLAFGVVPISPVVEAFGAQTQINGVARKHLCARIRGMILMAESDRLGRAIVLACGNKSELAVGYGTSYGDAVGGFAPIKDVSTTWVRRLARWRNDQATARGETPPVPEAVITETTRSEPPPARHSGASLPPYPVLDDPVLDDPVLDDPVLDDIVEDYVESDRGRDEMVASGFDPDLVDRVLRLVDRAEYKRRQYPLGTKVSLRSFGRDRRLPITNGWHEDR